LHFFQKKDVDNFTKFKKKRWSRCDFEDLTDVIIISTDKKEFHAHKCMLSARLDYFRSMFSMGWIESSSDKKTRLVILKFQVTHELNTYPQMPTLSFGYLHDVPFRLLQSNLMRTKG
jgi:hypothetical protein